MRLVPDDTVYKVNMAEMESAGLHLIREYIRRWQETISEKLDCYPIYEVYVEAERMTGTIQTVRWWYQDVVNEPEE